MAMIFSSTGNRYSDAVITLFIITLCVVMMIEFTL